MCAQPSTGTIACSDLGGRHISLLHDGAALRVRRHAAAPTGARPRQSAGPQLNRAAWRPARDYAADRLLRGALQLPAHTALLLDETRMSAGALSAAGVGNLAVGPIPNTDPSFRRRDGCADAGGRARVWSARWRLGARQDALKPSAARRRCGACWRARAWITSLASTGCPCRPTRPPPSCRLARRCSARRSTSCCRCSHCTRLVRTPRTSLRIGARRPT